MSTQKFHEHKCEMAYKFTVRERLDGSGPAFDRTRFQAVQINKQMFGDNDLNVESLSRHPTFDEAMAAATTAENDFLAEFGDDLVS
jgi:hypothetical protein